MTVTALAPGSESVCYTARAGEGDGSQIANQPWLDPDSDHLGSDDKGEGEGFRRGKMKEVEIGMTP